MSANSAGGPSASLSASSACGTQAVTVAAAHNRDDDTQVMNGDPSHSDSYEYLMHETDIDNFLLHPRKGNCHDELREALMQKRLERFNGVVSRPDTERWSHYSSTVLPEQTKAIQPLEVVQPTTPLAITKTYPYGL
jgi:erythromycin esterase-like protein